MMGPELPVEQLQARIGEELGVSEWIEVTQQRIDTFAKATDDFQFIHVDPERARQTPFGGTIAHGFLTLSLIPLLRHSSDIPHAEGTRMEVNYGGNKVRFLAPIRSGKRVRGRFKQLDLAEKRPGQWQQTLEITIEIEDEDTPALVAEWMIQFFV